LQQGLFLRRGILSKFCHCPWRTLKKAEASSIISDHLFTDLPLPQIRELDAPYDILVTGIGAPGSSTIGALLGMAAHLDVEAAPRWTSPVLRKKMAL